MIEIIYKNGSRKSITISVNYIISAEIYEDRFDELNLHISLTNNQYIKFSDKEIVNTTIEELKDEISQKLEKSWNTNK